MSALTARLLELLPDLKLHREVDNDREVMIYGSPGCGKTRSLGVILDAHLKAGLPSDQMLVNAFTRNATQELRRRLSTEYGLTDNEMPWVRTIHSTCFQLLQLRSEQVVTMSGLREFGESSGYKFQGVLNQRSVDDPYAVGSIVTFGDWCYVAEELRRALVKTIPEIVRMMRLKNPTDTPWGERDAAKFSDTYHEWKQSSGLFDFADMLEIVLRERLRPPVKWIFTDECLPGDSMVTLANGSQMPIREIVERRLSVSVLSYNPATDSIEPKRVTGWHMNPLRGRSLYQAGPLTATGNHPLLVLGKGYVPLERCQILDRVLQLTSENIRPLGEALTVGAINRGRIATWRRLDQLEPRSTGERTSSIRSGASTTRIPSVETRHAGSVVIPHKRSIPHLFRRLCLQLLHQEPSSLHRDSSNSSTQWPQDYHPSAPIVGGQPGLGGLVHGRWIITRQKHVYNSEQSFARRGEVRPGSSDIDGAGMSHPRNQEGSGDLLSLSLRQRIAQAISTIHSSLSHLQASRRSKANPSGSNDQNGAATSILRYLWTPNQQSRNVANLRLQGMRASTIQVDDGTISIAPPRQTRDNNRNLRDLWRSVQHYQEGAGSSSSSNMQRPVPSRLELENIGAPRLQSKAAQLDGSVYCLDVEDNHNFFANGILVKNCQDLTPCQWRVVDMWKEDADYLMAFGDVNQCIFAFSGAIPSEVWERPGHQMYLSHSYRLPSVVHAEALSIINRVPVAERAPGGFEPHYEGGEVDRLFGWADKPEGGMGLAERIAATADDSWLLLVRNRVFAEVARGMLVEGGIPFKDRTSSQGIPDPTRDRGLAIKVAAELNSGRLVRQGRLKQLMRQIYPDQWEVDRTQWSHLYGLPDLMKAGASSRLTEQLWNDPLEAIRMEPYERKYLKRIVKRFGLASLSEKPRVEISTIHGAKGEEADHVATSVSMTRRTYQEYNDNPDGENRVFYVAATRAKKTLIWIAEGHQGYRI
jgi:hypothetical protein